MRLCPQPQLCFRGGKRRLRSQPAKQYCTAWHRGGGVEVLGVAAEDRGSAVHECCSTCCGTIFCRDSLLHCCQMHGAEEQKLHESMSISLCAVTPWPG